MATLIQRLDWKRETGMTVTSGSVGHDCVISATRLDWRPVSRRPGNRRRSSSSCSEKTRRERDLGAFFVSIAY